MPPIDPDRFVSLVQPMLRGKDLPGLLSLLKQHWTAGQITSLLTSEHDDARKVAALALSLVGGKCCVQDLSQRLRDADPMVNQMAEHALWSVWFRCGSPEANHEVCRGSQAMTRRDLEHAVEHFSRAIEMDPNFAEAYNQRAIARFGRGEYARSVEDCEVVLRLNPFHFGAAAGMGQCLLKLKKPRAALRAFEQALEINPTLDQLRETVAALQEALDNGRRDGE